MQPTKNILNFEECEIIEELEDDFNKGFVSALTAAAAMAGLIAAITT